MTMRITMTQARLGEAAAVLDAGSIHTHVSSWFLVPGRLKLPLIKTTPPRHHRGL